MGHVPSAGSRSAFCSRPAASTDTGRVYFFTSSLLHFSSSLSTKTLAMLLNICRHQDTYNRGRAQNSAFKQEPAPSPGTLTATSECVFCRAARKTSPSWRAVPFKTVPLSPERMWIKECSLSVRRGFPTCHQDTETRSKVEGVSVPVYQNIDRSPACTGRNQQQTYTTHSRSPP